MKQRKLSLWIIVGLLAFCLGLILASFFVFTFSGGLIFGVAIIILILFCFLPGRFKLIALAILCLLLGFNWANFKKPKLMTPVAKVQGTVSGFQDCSATACTCPLKINNYLVVLKIKPEQAYLCVPGNNLSAIGLAGPTKYKSESLGKGISFYLTVSQLKFLNQNQSFWFRFLDWLLNIRQGFINAIKQLESFGEANFALGLVLGEKQDLPTSLINNLQNTGTSHLIALSGFNISILIFALFATLRLISPKFAFSVTSISILGFILMTGAPTSVVRAGIVGEFLILATILGRQNDSGLILLWSLFFIGLLSPFALVYDISLQLSFAAFLGIVYLAPLVAEKLKALGFIGGILSQTVGAVIFTLPLIAYYFGKISLIAVLPNILVVSVLPLVSYLIILAGISFYLFMPLAAALAFISQVFLDYMLWVINYFGSLKFSAVQLKIMHAYWFLPYYLVLMLALIWWWRLQIKKLSYG
jgi:ComEC/Rec2-related protein